VHLIGWRLGRGRDNIEQSRGVVVRAPMVSHFGGAMTPLHRRSLLLSSGAAALVGVACSGWAQAYPSRPVRIVEGAGPGGAPDIAARLIGKWLSERLGKPFVIDNKPGASGRIATDVVAKSAPDGYTLLMVVPTNCIDALIKDRLTYDFERDIVPVAGILSVPLVMEVHPSVPARTVAEFIALAKAEPDKINMASAGVGTGPHLAGELFQMMAGVSLFHVPFRGAQAIRDMVGGHAQVYFGPVISSLPHIKAGNLRALAVTSAARSPVLPDVPALAETLPGYEMLGWYGLGAPRGTPAMVIATLNREVNAALSDPAFTAQLAELGGIPIAGAPAGLGSRIAFDIEKIGNIIRVANIILE
jgi:tripartite-type tricarboxylate transporter receptor subunit TctC